MEICYPSELDRSQKYDILVFFDHFWPFWAIQDPWIDPPRVHILFYHSVLLPPYTISLEIMKICRLSEFDRSEIEKIQNFGQF